jgi:hypothetical protein
VPAAGQEIDILPQSYLVDVPEPAILPGDRTLYLAGMADGKVHKEQEQEQETCATDLKREQSCSPFILGRAASV